MLKFDGTQWTFLASSPAGSLMHIWGTAANNLWALTTNGVVVHWDGTNWDIRNPQGAPVLNLWGSDADHVLGVGDEGSIWTWGGNHWDYQTSIAENGLNGIWGSGADNVWVVGDFGMILQRQL